MIPHFLSSQVSHHGNDTYFFFQITLARLIIAVETLTNNICVYLNLKNRLHTLKIQMYFTFTAKLKSMHSTIGTTINNFQLLVMSFIANVSK